jgi:hypothetical protein
MLIDREYVQQFTRRIRKQGQHLRKHLGGPRQRSFDEVDEALEPLRRHNRGLLNAHNPYARERFFRAVAGNLARHLGAEAPKFELSEPVYFVTLIDRRHIVNPDPEYSEDWADYDLWKIRAAYVDPLFGLNHIGMLDVALYVSTQRTHGVDRFLHFHVHALVWGITERKLRKHRGRLWERWPLFPYASAVKCTPINPEDLLQMVWYTTKAPRSQYQVWKRATGRLKQAKRDLNGVNAVRVYAAMKDVTLDKLTLAGGEGNQVREQSLRDARTVSSPPVKTACSRRPAPKTWSTIHPVRDRL